MRSRGADAQIAELELGARPHHLERLRDRSGAAIFGDHRHDLFARVSGQRNERKFNAVARRENHAAAEAEDRIYNGSHGAVQIAPQRLWRTRAYCRVPEKFRGRFHIECSPGAPTSRCAVQMGVSSGERRRRCAISRPSSARSVSMNILANAG